jgi:hypothetical protein
LLKVAVFLSEGNKRAFEKRGGFFKGEW